MENCTMELFLAILSVVATIAAAVSAIFTYFNGKKMAYGNVELQIRTMISEAKYHQSEIMVKLAENPEDKVLQGIYGSLTEDVLNAYDEACAKYNDKKVDRERFKKMYFHEIRQLVENKDFADKYNSVSSRYTATLKVYKAWHQSNG